MTAVALLLALLAQPDVANLRRELAVQHVREVLDSLRKNDPSQQIYFEFAESEVNDYLAYALKADPRPGIQEASVRLTGSNRLTASLLVDFDAVKSWDASLIPAEMAPALTGRKMVKVDAEFAVKDRRVLLKTHSMELADLKLAPPVFQPMLNAIAARQPEKYDLTRPVTLPFELRTVWIRDRILGGEK